MTSSAVVGSSAMSRLGLAGEGHRDHHPLAHAAAERVRVLLGPLRGVGDVDAVEHLHGPPPRLLAAHVAEAADGLGDLVADGERRVEAAGRLLEDHADPAAPQTVHR